MSTNIYEDQENRVPVGVHQRGKHDESNFQNRQTQRLTLNANKRTVLGSLNINSNTRVQPRRAAKQGVTYESGIPQHNLKENDCSKSSTSSVLPFAIHEDSSDSCSSSSIGHSISSTNSSLLSSSTSILSSTSNRPKLKPLSTQNVIQSPIKNRIRGKNKENEEPSKAKFRSEKVSSIESPDSMDISVCDGFSGFSMVVDTPIMPREDILRRKDEDFWDVPEYAEDIYNYLRDAEVCHKPRANYMTKQTDITASMRWILVDWLVEVSEEYSLHTETLYLAVSYIDRFLSHMSVKRDKLQLVGTTAMFIASKYEEIYPPDVSQFAYITDNTYRVSQILRMEHLILKVLSFDMAVPTALQFVNQYCIMCKSNERTLHLAMFVSELSMLDSDPFLRFLPSKIAASAVAIANYTQGRPVWPDNVSVQSKYTLNDLKECYVNLHRAFCRVNESTQHAIRDKYKSSKWHNVSNITPIDGFPW